MSHSAISSYPPLFGERRQLAFPTLERIDFPARDGSTLCFHHTSGGSRGTVVLTPGTAMTALTYCLDSVPLNIVEFLVARGLDVWLLDWRTSPLLEAHKSPYTLDDVARYDWPAAIELVRKKTGQRQVSVLAHCLSSPTFLLSMVRGYLSSDSIRAMVASQVALHLRFTPVGTAKVKLHLDRLLPSNDMVHQRPQNKDSNLADIAASFMSLILPTTFSCNNRACYRHVATFGELILHSRIDSETHAIMGDLVPECLTAFLKDVAAWGRKDSILTEKDLDHLDRLQLPIHFISGSENRMFVPESTEASWRFLSEANDESYYRRTVYQGFGHLDCYFGHGASEQIWPDIANTLAA
ncbi:MAG: hypothetical protein WA704_18930 [Pseudolabrys sp.]